MLALVAVVFVHLGLDGVRKVQHVQDDVLLVRVQGAVHLVDADARVGVDLVGDALAGADVLWGKGGKGKIRCILNSEPNISKSLK